MDPGRWRKDFFGSDLDFGITPKYRREKIPLGWIAVLPQPRQTFEGIEELAWDIAQSSFLYPPIVCAFDKGFFEKYLEVINRIWGMGFNSQNLPQGADGKVYTLIDGERRIRAAQYLLDHSCEDCGLNGGCFEKHFPGGLLELTICRNISPHKAISIQFRANMHMSVPAHEEAEAMARNWRFIKQVDPSFSLARFAREIGRSPDTVRNAVKFCELPEEIQDMVRRKYIPYGIALELARAQANGVKDVRNLMTDAMVGKQKVSEFRGIIDGRIRDLKSGQQSLDLIFQEIQETEARQKHLRRVAGEQFLGGVWNFNSYMRVLLRLFEENLIALKCSPLSSGGNREYSPNSPIRVLREHIRLMRGPLSEHLRVVYPLGWKKAEEILQNMETILENIEKETAA